jgi:hypothetical protein
MDYEANRRLFPNLLAERKNQTRIWMGLFGVMLAYHFVANWHRDGVVVDLKLAATKCEPVVLDQFGQNIPVVSISSADMSVVDGLVFARLKDTVECLRKLDPEAGAMEACWRKQMTLFRHEEAKNKLQAFRALQFPSREAVAKRLRYETVEVDGVTFMKPDSNLPHRYLLRWNEKHVDRSGNAISRKPESWSGLFDVELVQLDPRSGDPNPVHIKTFSWKRDDVSGS